MENAQLISLSRQVALERQMDVLANNMANINTAGFKNETMLFSEYLMPVARDRDFGQNDQLLSYTEDWATIHDFRAGPVRDTGNELDVALDGDGFFAVQTPDGVRYTRDGSFKLDPTGTLVTNDGFPVLSEGDLIRFESSETNITFGTGGGVFASGGSKGRLRIVSFDNPMGLVREGSNLFSAGDMEPIANLTTKVKQGALEQSNVSGVTEMANMVRVTRAYEQLASLMKQQDDLRRTAIKTLGDAFA